MTTNISVQEDQTNKEERIKKGEFVRGISTARNWIKDDPNSAFPLERDRYHLYIANNCPWCHRCVITRNILGLQDVISMDVVFYKRDAEHGWQFRPELDKYCTKDTINNMKYIKDIYKLSGLTQTSVPILFDKKQNIVVNNESAEIIRMFATVFTPYQSLPKPLYLYPDLLKDKIDALNAWIYPEINNGAYKAGFSSNQDVYDKAFDTYFNGLDKIEKILSKSRYLCSNDYPTEADIRLFPTLFRQDCVYFVRMKLNKKFICYEYPNIYGWLKDIYQFNGVKQACNMDHCKKGYFGRTGNNIIPKGPEYDWDSKHNRNKVGYSNNKQIIISVVLGLTVLYLFNKNRFK